MFIKNLKTGMIHEILNEDVIAQCSKDDNYIVKKTREELDATPIEKEPKEVPEEIEEPKEAAEAPTEPEETPDYSTLTVKELREIAKDKGIQGYKNMNKDTLIAVIEAH